MKKLTPDDIALAKVGLMALIDEATGYQEERPKDDLSQELEKHTGRRKDPMRNLHDVPPAKPQA